MTADDPSGRQPQDPSLDKKLDDELEQTFPASDPPKIIRTGAVPAETQSTRRGDTTGKS